MGRRRRRLHLGVATPSAPPIKSTEAKEIEIAAGPFGRIIIGGARTTLSGEPGIVIHGVHMGIEGEKSVGPFFRFPGQTSFAGGSVCAVISGGAFE